MQTGPRSTSQELSPGFCPSGFKGSLPAGHMLDTVRAQLILEKAGSTQEQVLMSFPNGTISQVKLALATSW